MTSETDLREVSAQIEIVKQLIDNPETFDIHKILIELETKKKRLMKYKPRDYITILKEFYPEEIIPKIEEPKVDTEKISEIKRLKEKIKTLQEVKPEEAKEEIPGE